MSPFHYHNSLHIIEMSLNKLIKTTYPQTDPVQIMFAKSLHIKVPEQATPQSTFSSIYFLLFILNIFYSRFLMHTNYIYYLQYQNIAWLDILIFEFNVYFKYLSNMFNIHKKEITGICQQHKLNLKNQDNFRWLYMSFDYQSIQQLNFKYKLS